MERIPQDVLHYHILPRCAIDTRLAFKIPPTKIHLHMFNMLEESLRRRKENTIYSRYWGNWASCTTFRIVGTQKMWSYYANNKGDVECSLYNQNLKQLFSYVYG
jgi:hypothetical protein